MEHATVEPSYESQDDRRKRRRKEEDMRAILFERKMINYSSAATLSKKG